MSAEGLQSILTKEEIVATQRAADLFERPEIVDETYKRHVRTYVPLGRKADERETGQSVARFERKVIREVQQGGALRGYITAEYGHGKTSTALYLWERARAENLLAVPPFQLNKLADLIIASFGWVRYEIGRTRPNLVGEAQALYDSLMERSAQTLAKQYEGMSLAAAQRLAQDRPDILELSPIDYLHFFEKMTALAQEAGFDGLLIIADEVQQYIDPEVKSDAKDPASPLFDVISAILTRRNRFNFGLLLVIPPKELDVLRDQRGDLIHRILQVSLDLRTVYNRDFPGRLWYKLAEDFEEHRHTIINDECLSALGQISARKDLADGPRTVVNVFRRATQRYIDLGYPKDEPYTPYHLIDDFMNGKIQYDSPKKIPQTIARVLSHSLVKGHTRRERAVKWAAAFPSEGIPRSLQERLGLAQAFDELAQSGLSDLIISVGDVSNRGFTLRGLEEVLVKTDWLSTTIREFWRIYHETAAVTQQRTTNAFLKLLVGKLFPDNQWTVSQEIPGRMTQNTGLILRGSFNSFARRFPERDIHVRVLWEDEDIKDAAPLGEAVIQIRLKRYLDWPEEKRRQHIEPVQVNYDNRQIELTLNLMRRDETIISPQLDQTVGPIVSPYKLTPLLLLTLYQVIEEKRDKNLIPKTDDQQIRYGFQLDLFDNVFRLLMDADVGKPLGAAQERIVEVALDKLLTSTYPEYDTLIRVSNWSSSLQKYVNALKHLETAHERQGQIVYEGTKDEIASLFTLSNTGFDSFVSNFPSLIEITRKFPSRSDDYDHGAVRFQLHDLEKKIRGWLQTSRDIEKKNVAGKTQEIHRLLLNEVYRQATDLGYRDKEIDTILDLMDVRGLIERDRKGMLHEAITQAPSIDELTAEIEAWQEDISILQDTFAQSSQLRQWQEKAEEHQAHVNNKLRIKPDDEKVIMLRRSVQNYRRSLQSFFEERHQQLQQEAEKLFRQLPAPDTRQKKVLETQVLGLVDYAKQVNDVRLRVLRQFTAMAGKLERLQTDVQATKASLKTEDLSLASFIRLANAQKQEEKQAVTLRTERDEFTGRFNEYVGWTSLVEHGSQLQEEIQTLGELVRSEREQFQQLSQEVNGHLSANKLDALPDAPTYEARLNEIAQAVRRKRAEATNLFNALQDRYRDSLVTGLGFPRDRLWLPHQYNPIAPDDSYMRLVNSVQAALREFHEQLSRVIMKEQESIRSTLRSPLLASLPSNNQELLQKQGDKLESDFTRLSEELAGTHKWIDDTDVVNDFPKDAEGHYHKLLQALAPIGDQLTKLHPQVDTLNRKLQIMELTGTEENVLKAMPSDLNTVEVSKLRQAVPRVSEQEFWQALSGLHAKRRLRIIVETVRHD